MTLKLNSAVREVTGGKVDKIRAQGIIPAVVYGHKMANQNLAVKNSDFNKIFAQSGESTLIELTINDNKPIKVLIKEVQREPLTNEINHIDFQQVSMDEKLTAEVPLKFIGEPKAVKELGGILVKVLDHIEIECLPGDLISELDIDISGLANFGDKIHIKDLTLPKGVKVTMAGDDAVVLIEEPVAEKEEAVEAAKPAEAEVIGKEKKEEAAEEKKA